MSTTTPRATTGFPPSVFDAPVLRGLDARAHRELESAGRLVELAEGQALFGAGEGGESFFVVAKGKVGLFAVRRGDDVESEIRAAGPGESIGEEATIGLPRRARAVALERVAVAEIPVHVFRRAAGRAGAGEVAERLERVLRRAATRDLFATIAFTRDLPERDLDVLLDAATYQRVARGHTVYREGDPSLDLYLVADGLVQIQTEDADRLHVRAYIGRGDFFGDAELDRAVPRAASAVASGPSALLAIPARVVRSLADEHPDLLPRLRRVAEGQLEAQRALVGKAAMNATQHAFRDVYRLKIARSLLVIDLEACVRCGHCAWACEDLYGEARLVRRGDKMVARLDGREDDGPSSLMLPNSCQHCENPACMVDCPTGAIGKDPEGEVFIRPELCTGCSACAKACPWDNIQMAPRPSELAAPHGTPPDANLAVKCDLCRGYEGPACVKACPTGAIFRLNPAEEVADIRELFGGARSGKAAERPSGKNPFAVAGAAVAAIAVAVVGRTMHARGLFAPGRGLALAAGVFGAVAMLMLLGYAVPKRRIRSFMRPRKTKDDVRERTPGSVVERHLSLHLALGLVALGSALAHSPTPGRNALGAALWLSLVGTSALGGGAALAYRFLPTRLARLERSAALPEDFDEAKRDLEDRLYREISGKSELVKKLVEKVLLPYARSPFGPALLLASGRSLREEEKVLRARIDDLLEGRGKERLAGLDELVRIVVELRAKPAQRLLGRALRVWLPLHIVTFALAIGALLLHVAAFFRR